MEKIKAKNGPGHTAPIDRPTEANRAAPKTNGGDGKVTVESHQDSQDNAVFPRNFDGVLAKIRGDRTLFLARQPWNGEELSSPQNSCVASPEADQLSIMEAWVDRIGNQIGKTAQSIVVTGQMLIEAKTELDHGQWEGMFAPGKLPISIRTAQHFMQVAHNEALTNAKNSSFLPVSREVLTRLSRLDASVVQAGINEGKVGPDMTIKAVNQFARDQRGTQLDKAQTGFDFDATLKSLVKKVQATLDRVPAGQRKRFCTALVSAINGSAKA
jgi:hypothetical protein